MVWTTITNAQLAVGAPLRSVDLLALRDNITAQANGDAGAPKQQTAGIADNAVTPTKLNFVANGLRNNGGSLDISCPSYNSIGSYAGGYSGSALTVGSNYSAASAGIAGGSGTWKCMGITGYGYGWNFEVYLYITEYRYIFCRVA